MEERSTPDAIISCQSMRFARRLITTHIHSDRHTYLRERHGLDFDEDQRAVIRVITAQLVAEVKDAITLGC
jgi:hypothetical protein